jgi:sugar transferase (PEP-CTERM/EpsH1 system associated)
MKVLFLTHRLPYAPNRGDRIRAYHMLRTLQAEVHVISLVHDDEEARRAADLRRLVASVTTVHASRAANLARALAALPTNVPLTHCLLDAAGLRAAIERVVSQHSPDVVFAYCSGMARFALEPPLSSLPCIVDLVDIDSAKWSDWARNSAGPMRWIYEREARCLGAFEAEAARRAYATLVVNERERQALTAQVPDADIRVISNGIDVHRFRSARVPAARDRVVFCGVLDYRPNERGALWFAREVWPKVRQQRQDAVLTLVGANPTAAIRALPSTDASIEVTGRVPDVRPYLWDSAVAIAPLAEARGLQNKVLEAVAAGLPTVITRIVADGLPASVMPACVVADDPGTFTEAVVDLLNETPEERRARAVAADLSHLGWADQLAPLLPTLQAAASQQIRVRLGVPELKFRPTTI